MIAAPGRFSHILMYFTIITEKFSVFPKLTFVSVLSPLSLLIFKLKGTKHDAAFVN